MINRLTPREIGALKSYIIEFRNKFKGTEFRDFCFYLLGKDEDLAMSVFQKIDNRVIEYLFKNIFYLINKRLDIQNVLHKTDLKETDTYVDSNDIDITNTKDYTDVLDNPNVKVILDNMDDGDELKNNSKELVELRLMGYTNEDISFIYNVSVRTIERYFNKLRERYKYLFSN